MADYSRTLGMRATAFVLALGCCILRADEQTVKTILQLEKGLHQLVVEDRLMDAAELKRDIDTLKTKLSPEELGKLDALHNPKPLPRVATRPLPKTPAGEGGKPALSVGDLPTALRQGLICWLAFEEAEGYRLEDRSGVGNHGLRSDAGRIAAGKRGRGLQITAESSTRPAIIPHSPAFEKPTLTVSIWFRTQVAEKAWERIVEKRSSGASFMFNMGSEIYGKDFSGIAIFETVGWVRPKDDLATDNRWHHMVASYDGQTMTALLDGTHHSTRRFKKATPFAFKKGEGKLGAWDLVLGGGTYVTRCFVGDLDELMVFDRVLPRAEMEALFRWQE